MIKYLDAEGLKVIAANMGKGEKGDPGEPGKSAYQSAVDGGFSGEESVFNTEIASIGDISNVLDEINGDGTSPNVMTPITNDEIDAIIAAAGGSGTNGGSGSSTISTGMTPFRINITKSPKAATSSLARDSTIGPWANLGPWQLATCYASTDLQVAGIYNNDIIQIFGFTNTGGGYPSEYLNTPSIVINRSDGNDLDNFVPDFSVADAFISNNTGYRRKLGTISASCWRDTLGGSQHYYLKMSLITGVSIDDSSNKNVAPFGDYGSSSSNTIDAKYDIGNIACNFAWARKDLLQTKADNAS